jgi:hypothetical protein
MRRHRWDRADTGCVRCGLERRLARFVGRTTWFWLYRWEAAGEWITAAQVPECTAYPKMAPKITGGRKR